MQSMYIIIVVVLYVKYAWLQTWSWTKQSTSEHVKTSLSEKQKTKELCTEPIEEKRTKIIESSSSH